MLYFKRSLRFALFLFVHLIKLLIKQKMKKLTTRLVLFSLLFSIVLVGCKEKETSVVEPKEEEVEVETKSVVVVQTPQPSPASKLEQTVGLTDVTIEYSRPSMKGRTIFGDLVPYDKVWRTGANANTKITFNTDVTFGEKAVPAGTYALYSKPNADSWEVMLYTDTDNWGNPQEWDDNKVAATAKVDVMKMPMDVETFTITIDDLTNSSALIGLLWEDVYVGVPISVPTDAAVMESIKTAMENNPDARAYYNAAVYYMQEDKDVQMAKNWIDSAVEMSKDDPKFWMLRQQSLIHAKAGEKETAIAAAKKSLELAKKAGNDDYVKMNEDSLKEWGAM